MRNIVAPLSFFLFTFLFCILAVTAPSSCGGSVNCNDPAHALDATCVAQNILVECAGSDVAGVITQYTPTVDDIIQKGLQPDGSINWSLIETDLISAVARYGWCVVSAVFDHYMNPAPTVGSGSAVAAVAGGTAKHPTPAAAKDAFNKLRAKLWPQARFKTSSGRTL